MLELSGNGIGRITANFTNGPWSAEVYSSGSETMPTTFEDWGLRTAHAYADNAGTGTFDVQTPGRWMLLKLVEISASSGCSNANPYRGSISDLSFTSAP